MHLKNVKNVHAPGYLPQLSFVPWKKHLFDETTPRAEVATSFCITAAQLNKAVTSIVYQSGPHPYKRKRKTTKTASTSTKLQKTDAGLARPQIQDVLPQQINYLATQRYSHISSYIHCRYLHPHFKM